MYKPTNIMPLSEIATSCHELQTFLEAHYEADNPNAVVQRGNYLESYMAISGKMLADAKYHYNEMVNSHVIEAVRVGNEGKMGTSTINKYIEALCRDAAYYVDWCDRINRACTHQLDFQRTIISKLKEEIRQLQYAR